MYIRWNAGMAMEIIIDGQYATYDPIYEWRVWPMIVPDSMQEYEDRYGDE